MFEDPFFLPYSFYFKINLGGPMLRKFFIAVVLLLSGLNLAQADFMSDSSGKAFLGFGAADSNNSSINPIIFGADYRIDMDHVDFFQENGLRLLGGLLYWSESEGPLDFSILEVSSGLEKSLDFQDFIVNFGGRVGLARIKATVAFFGTTISDTDTQLFIAPYGEFLYPINEKMAVGAEVRIPIYLGDGFDAFDIFYLLGSFNYIF